MNSVVRISLLWMMFSLMALPACAVEATLVADAHVNNALPAVNSGTISNLNVGNGYTALLQFDLSMIPAGTTAAQVSRAVLRLYCNRVDTPGQVNIQAMGGAWGEYSVTYATLPSLGNVAQTVSVNQPGTYVTFDLTTLVQGWISASTTNNGVALTAGSAAVQFDSKENDLTGHAALLDITLASTGIPGATGATGATGPQGLPGAQGAQGLTGPKGDTGATGPQGVPGLQGPQGPSGPQGPADVTYRGNYDVTANYGLRDAVSFGGTTFISLIDNNVGNAPSASPSQWAILAAQGVAGPVGATGPAGLTGATGATGTAGAVGATGAAGPQGPPISFLGSWLAGTSYITGNAVSFGGTSYVAFTPSLGKEPDSNPTAWGVLAQSGTPGLNYRGAWISSAAYQLRDAVLFSGTTYLAIEVSSGLEPDSSPGAWAVLAQAGTAGPAGPTGPAASVVVGTVTTSAAGTQATVTNTGTFTAAVLNFTIPQGAAGTVSGGGGGSGTSGTSFASVYHDVSFSNAFYSVNSTTESAPESNSVLTWVPGGCTATKLSVFSLQSNTITVTLRQGTPSHMADTTMFCSAASASACSVTGDVVVPEGNFVDLSVGGASGTVAGVWMSLACS